VKATGLHVTYIAKLVKSGMLPVVRLIKGGRAFYRKEDIERIFQIKL
jgi:DNA-binding transcriptional MerR regulator